MVYHLKNIITNRTIRYTFSSVWRSTTYCTSPQQPHLRQLFGSMEGSLCANGLRARTTEPSCQHILQTFKRLHSDAFEWGQKTSKTDKATKPNKMVVASTKYAVLVWNPDSETSCFCFNIYMAEAHPSLCQARCHEGISILDQLMVTDHLEVSKISPKIWFYMVLLCKVPPFWEAGMTLDMMFLPVFQKSPLHKYGSPMRVPPDSSAQKFWMTSICKCRVRFQTEKIAVKCQIC